MRQRVNLAELVEKYVKLTKSGSEFMGLCPFHQENTPSFTVVPAKGFYHCFGCGAHGDCIAFVQEIEGLEFKDAVEKLVGKSYVPTGAAVTPREKAAVEPEWVPIVPVPPEAPNLFQPDGEARLFNPKRAGTSKEWTTLTPVLVDAYRNAERRLVGYVLRCEFRDGGKFTPQVTFCENKAGERRWCLVSFPEPRCLLGADELSDRPDAPVLWVEGEKARRAAMQLLPNYVVVTNPGGVNGVAHTDWRPLYGRDVLFWPDADEPGRLAVIGRQNGASSVRAAADYLRGNTKRLRWINVPTDIPEGWDADDALKAGKDRDWVISWAKKYVQDVPVPVVTAVKPAEPTPSKPVPAAPTPKAAKPQAPAATPPRANKPAGRAAGQAAGKPGRPSKLDKPQLGVVDAGGAVRAPAAKPEPDAATAAMSLLTLWETLQLEIGRSGAPHQNLDNCVRALMNHSDTKDKIWFDEFYRRLFTSWRGPVREWSDADDLLLALWFQRELGITKCSPQQAHDAVMVVGSHNTHNEPKEWMNSLTWDGTLRIRGSLTKYFGAKDDDYTQAAGENFWTSMVARIFNPGCKVDNMLVLEADQGKGKSQALAVIGGKWYAEAHEAVTSKDFFLALTGVMLMEIGELDSFSRAETTKVKQVITCQTDRYRSPYGRNAENHPRRNVFVGTTNDDRYLRDSTGGRRFWPVNCGDIDIPALRNDREQLFAEAVAKLKHDAQWWLMPEQLAKLEQEARRQHDEWEFSMQTWLRGRSEATIADVCEFVLDIPIAKMDRLVQLRVADAFRALGWHKTSGKGEDGRTKRLWRPKDQVSNLRAAAVARERQPGDDDLPLDTPPDDSTPF